LNAFFIKYGYFSYMTENGGDAHETERIVLLNMCAEIFPSKDSNCPYGSAVCEPSKGISYGSALTLQFKKNPETDSATMQARLSFKSIEQRKIWSKHLVKDAINVMLKF
jgi:hypothetical protein